MGILKALSEYINENYIYEGYEVVPIAHMNPENNVSFVVNDSKYKIATIKIMKTDGSPVDATNDTYDYKDVYADVNLLLEGKEHQYDIENIKKWILNRITIMNYASNPTIIDGDKYDANEYKDESLNTTQYAARRGE